MPRPPLAGLVRTVATDAATDTELLARFRRGDATAFETLARRHGGRVWAACRSVLGDTPDAEDAFQAAFVVLARGPAAVRKGHAVGSWLYGVARRIALKARARRDRRTQVEARATPPADARPPDLSWREAVAILHEELDRLPAKYRDPLMLCYLDGLPREEAAQALGCSLDVVKGRLERGREALRWRLTRRGVTLSAGLLAAVAADARSDPGPSVYGIAARIARPSPAVASLVPAGTVAPTRFRVAGLGLAATVVIGLVLGLPQVPPAERPKKDPPPPVAKAEPKGDRIAFAGTVVDPAGKPVAGAKVHLLRYMEYDVPNADTTVKAMTDGAGRFWFDVAAADYPFSPTPGSGWWYRYTGLVAVADGFGLGVVPVTAAGVTEARLALVEDVPLRGRLVTLEGKPVAGAAVSVVDVGIPKDGLAAVVQTAEKLGWNYVEADPLRVLFRVGRLRSPFPLPPTTTDAVGRFTLRGVGRDRVVTVGIEGRGIAAARLTVFTEPGPTGSVGLSSGGNSFPKFNFYRLPFDYVTAPVQPFEGRVTDRDTGRPVSGLKVFSLNGEPGPNLAYVRDTTDSDGKYKLIGLDPGQHAIQVEPGPDDPYYVQSEYAGRAGNLEPVRVDFVLKPTAWLIGRVTDERTGKPVAGCQLRYYPADDNAATIDYLGPRRQGLTFEAKSGPDGRYRIKAVPGKGWLTAWPGPHNLVPARERDGLPVAPTKLAVRDQVVTLTQVAAVVPATAALSAEAVVAVVVDSGVTVSVRLTTADGKPVTGVQALGADGYRAEWSKPLDPVEVRTFNPARPRPVLFVQPDRGLAAVVQARPGDAGPWNVRMYPTATVRGKLVHPDGKPLANTDLMVLFELPPYGRASLTGTLRETAGTGGVGLVKVQTLLTDKARTDADGRFEIRNVIGDLDYELRYPYLSESSSRGTGTHPFRARPGEAKDLGTITMKIPPG